jgi:hypothetical protein
MACCGNGKVRSGTRPNGKICPKCGWIMHRVHKYDNAKKQVYKYFQCTNKTQKCHYRENIS